MAISFSPTREDVERYRRLRALSADLNRRILETLPRRAFEDIGETLGIFRGGILMFDNAEMMSVMTDCCFFDWYENGKNLVQQFADAHPAVPGTDESYLLQAYLQAKYRILTAQSTVPGAGLYCEDVLNGGELFLMDIAFSQTLRPKHAIATRTVPLGEFWVSCGAGLPIDRETDVVSAVLQIESGLRKPIEQRAMKTLTIVRACLNAGAADHIAYERPPSAPKPRPREPRFVPRRRRRPPENRTR